MDVKNVLNSCAQTGGNTGYGECFTNIRFIKGILFVPTNMTFSTSSVAALKTALEAAILADLPINRVYPIGNIVSPVDNSEQNVEQTFADGSKAVVREGYYDWTFEFVKGGFCLLYALRKANGMNRSFLLFDDTGKLYGTDAGLGLMKGIVPALGWTPPFKLNSGAAVTVYSTRLNFSPDQINENIAFVDFSNDGGLSYLNGLTGLQNVNLLQLVAPTATVVKVGAKTSCGTVNLHDLYASELAVVGAWRAKNSVTGAVVTISAVADDPTDGGWSLTLTTPPAKVDISLAPPTELDGLNVSGYESNVLTETMS